MPGLDSISEWVLANLYLVGAVTGVVLLLILLILLLVGRRERGFDEQAGGRGAWQEDERLSGNEETDVFGETLAPAPVMEPPTPFTPTEPFTSDEAFTPDEPFTHEEPLTDASHEPPPTAARADAAADDAAPDMAPHVVPDVAEDVIPDATEDMAKTPTLHRPQARLQRRRPLSRRTCRPPGHCGITPETSCRA